MPRSADFYQQKASQSLPVTTAQPAQELQVQQSAPPADSGGGINSPQNIAATNRGFWSFFGEGLREVFTGRQDNWDNMSFAQKSGALAKGTGKMGLNIVTSLPRTVVKAPVGVGMTILEGVDEASQKLFGTKQFVPDKIDLTGIFGNNAVTRYFGDVSGVRASYNEAKAMGSGSKFDTFLAAVTATGKFTGDLAISASLVNSIRGAFKPSLKTVEKPVLADDIRPKVPDQLSQIKMKVADSLTPAAEDSSITSSIKTAVGKKLGVNPTITFKQDPNAAYFRLPKGAAAQYGGSSANTFLRVASAGGETAEFSVVQIRPSMAGRLLSKLQGKGQIIETEMGPGVKIESGLVKYDPGEITKAGDQLPDFLQSAAPAEAAVPAAAAPGATAATIDAVQPAMTVYRAGEPFDPAKMTDFGISVAKNKTTTDIFGGKTRGVQELGLSSNAKILTDIPDNIKVDENFDENVTRYARENGYDGVDMSKYGVDEIRVINPAVLQAPSTAPTPGVVPEPTVPNPKFERAAEVARAMTGAAPPPGVMQEPLKGFESSPVEPRQMAQINFIAKERGIDDKMLNVITNALTGKGSVSQLNQSEAFNVAETMRLFNQADPALPGAGDMVFRPFTQPARYWMEAAERELKYPVYSRGYIPIETGFRLADKVLFPQLNKQITEAFGKYADPKYLPELRLLTSYVEGNTGVITENAQLSPETKAELTKIGDFARQWFEKRFDEGGIKSDRFKGSYAPKLRQLNTIFNLYKQEGLPAEIQPFYTFERAGSDAPLEDNLLVLMQVYAKAFSRNKFLKAPLEQAISVGNNLPDNLKKSFNDYLQEKLGYQGEIEKKVNNWGAKLNKATNGYLPVDVIRRTISVLMNNSYAATLGLPRVMPVISQFMQSAVMNYAEFGDDPKLLLQAYKKMFDKKAMEEWNNSGFSVDHSEVYGGEFASKAAQGKVGKAVDAYEKAQEYTLKPFSKTDAVGRAPMYFAIKQRFTDNWSAFVDGKITFDQFEKNIKLDGFNPTLQNIVRQKLLENTPQSVANARDLVIQDTIDSSFFPYRKGSESRMFYGLKGKVGLQYASFPFEYGYTLKSWIARKQWGKLLRWYAMSTAIDRSVKEGAGVNVGGYLALGPLSTFAFGPLVKAGQELINAYNSANQDNTEELDKSYADVTAALKNYGGAPFGVGAQRLQAFYKSVHRMEAGISVSTDPDPLKRFGIYSSTGKLKQWVTFADLLKYTFGFNPEEFSDLKDRTNAVKKAQMRYDAKKSEAINALVDGDFGKFDRLVTENQIQIGDLSQTLNSYRQPLDQRLFTRMPAPLKSKYINLFYPSE